MDVSAFDVFILALRVAFIFLLYFFLFMVVRVIVRELNAASRRARYAPREPAPYQAEEPYYAAANGLPGRLVVTEVGNATTVRPGMVLELGPVTPIGRRGDNAIILNDDFVSNEHSLVALRDGQWWLSDIASTNGTYLNGERLQAPRPLKIGDLVGVGRVKMRLEA